MLATEAFFVTVLLIISLIAALLIEKKKIPYIHESAFFIILGVIASIIMNSLQETAGPGIQFDHEVFFTIILPPIILSAGYTLRKKEFFGNFKYIALFGGFGTIIAFVTLTFLADLFAQLDFILEEGKKLSLPDCMMLACILSSTDTVAALSLVKPEEYPKLSAILFGEGIINDAVSILLFRTVKTFFVDQHADVELTLEMMLKIAGDFIYLSFFSLLIGISFALLLSIVFKKFHDFAEKPKLETSLVLLISYASYLVAESLHFSGIIALFSCGLVMSHYTYQNLSEESQKGTTLVFDSFGYLAETFVFIYLGITIVNFDYTEVRVLYTILMIFSVVVARLFAIFLAPAVFLLFRSEINLTLKEMKVIWYSGLVRGAISFGLGWLVVSAQGGLIRSTTLGVVVFTVFVLTSFLEAFAKRVGLGQNIYTEIEDLRKMLMPTMGEEVSKEHMEIMKADIQMKSMFDKGLNDNAKPSKLQQTFMKFESKYVQPIFGSKAPLKTESPKTGSLNELS